MNGKGCATVERFLLPIYDKSLLPVFKIPAQNFVGTLAVNVDNAKLTDKEFRDFVRKTLSIVKY